MSRTLAVGALAAALLIGAGIIVAAALGSESWAIALLGLLVVGLCGALFEVGRRLRDLMALLRGLPATTSVPRASSAEGSLERTEPMEGDIRKIQDDIRKIQDDIRRWQTSTRLLARSGRRTLERNQSIAGDIRKIQADIRRWQTSTRLLARSGYRSLERSQRLESEIENLAAEEARNATTQRRIIAAVETERLAAAEREQVVISKIEEAGERLLRELELFRSRLG